MQTLVETFECHETASEPIEATEEAVSIIEAMGLSGQATLLKKADGKAIQRCPYREMTSDEADVYRELCPDSFPLDKYDRSPIPLRVLQIASHAQSLGLFAGLRVWDRTSAAVKDPVLVAWQGNYDWSPTKLFILARWGEVLEAFAVLRQRAAKSKRERLLEECNVIRATIEGAADEKILSGATRVNW